MRNKKSMIFKCFPVYKKILEIEKSIAPDLEKYSIKIKRKSQHCSCFPVHFSQFHYINMHLNLHTDIQIYFGININTFIRFRMRDFYIIACACTFSLG
jgi:hypothetical protein